MQEIFFIADLIACSTCFGHHYTHHQELESIIQLVAACRLWCLVFKLSVWCSAEGCVSGLRAAAQTTGGNQLYNILELLMMGIMVPETCWASNKICNKKHLFRLVGNLFPHSIPLDFLSCIFFRSAAQMCDIKEQRYIEEIQRNGRA
jgi:hypothetical protein